jgi:hypothetical protein
MSRLGWDAVENASPGVFNRLFRHTTSIRNKGSGPIFAAHGFVGGVDLERHSAYCRR